MSDEEFVCEICDATFDSERELLTHDCDEWVRQTGLGDADARGQTTLDGGVRPEGGRSR